MYVKRVPDNGSALYLFRLTEGSDDSDESSKWSIKYNAGDAPFPLADFQTFYFNKEWSGLARVEIPTPLWSLDNLVVSVPEPNGEVLFLAAGLAFWLFKRKRMSRS
jgi:hypothetical protein